MKDAVEPMEEGESVVRRYAPMVYRLALAQVRGRCDAEDIFQEVFLRYFVVRLFFLKKNTAGHG